QGIVDRLADRLGRSVAIDDPSVRLLAASRHFGDEDPVRIRVMLSRQADRTLAEYAHSCGISRSEKPVRIPGRPEPGLRSRVCVPIRWSRQLLGFPWLIDPGTSLGEEEIGQAVTAAEAASMVLYRRALLHEHERGRQEALLRDLVSADPAARARAQDEIAGSGPMAAAGQVALASVDVIAWVHVHGSGVRILNRPGVWRNAHRPARPAAAGPDPRAAARRERGRARRA
ncbi:MAG TPA: hypothetical protein VKV80_17870, partial [Streptosporangiaceae bacterium]|nr:hypothetical protein [Streptosporangiaceae bacterium]